VCSGSEVEARHQPLPCALVGDGSENADLTRLVELRHLSQENQHHWDLAGDEVLEGRRGATVRHMSQLKPERLRHLRAERTRHRTGRRTGKSQGAGLTFRPDHEFLQRLRRVVRPGGQGKGKGADWGDRLEVNQGIAAQHP
jgi:hypothetical protein